MSNKNGWGDGASNNTIGWGQGANNYIGWGSSELVSYEGLTNIVGAFTTEWTTTANSEQIFLPYGTGTYTGTINWGDGSTDINDGSVTTHTYATAGTYTVIIDGDCIGWDTNIVSGSTYWTSVVNWGQLQLGTDNFGYNFAYCPNLDLSSVQGTLDLTGVTVLDGLFFDCTSLTTINNINSWDTSAITGMAGMFAGCSVFNQSLSFDTSAVTNMLEMFRDAPAFNQNIGTWNVANVTSFNGFMTGKTDATFSTTNLNAIYNGWSTQSVQPSLTIDFGTAKYTSAATAGRAALIAAPNNWTITDGGLI